MRFAVFLVVLQICDCKHNIKPKSRSVNLALETVLQFDKNDNSADLQVIDKVQDFLRQIKSYIGKPKNYRKSYNDRRVTFTEFIKNAILILNDYNDRDLEDLAAVVNDEIRNYHYRGCRFNELIDNRDFRRFMAKNLDKITNASAENIREYLGVLYDGLHGENLGLKHRMIVKYIDALYSKDDAFKLGTFLDNLSLYRRKSQRTNSDLVRIIRNGLRSVVFDHYSKLDVDTRRDIKIKLEAIWKDYNGLKRHQRIWKFDTNTKLTKPDVIKYTTPSPDSDESVAHSKASDSQTEESLEEEDSIERDLIRMKQSTNKRKLTFITLYPEAITFTKRKYKEVTKSDYTEATYQKLKTTKTRQQSKYNREAPKEIIHESGASVFVKKQKITAVDEYDNYNIRNPRTKKMRYNIVRRYPAIGATPISKSRTNKVSNARKFTANSFGGISIGIHKERLSRKNNNIDIFNSSVTATTAANTTTEIDYRKRVGELEKELEVIKARMIETTNVTDAPTPPNEILDFWDGTTTQRVEFNQTNVNATTTVDYVNIELTSEVNGTVNTTISTPKVVFRSKDESVELDKNDGKINQTTARTEKTTKDKLITKMDTKKDAKTKPKRNEKAKPKIIDSANVTTQFLNGKANGTKIKELSRKNVEEETLLSETDVVNENFDIEAYLNETKLTDEKSERVRQKMLEDVQKMLPENDTDANEVTPSATVIPTIGVDDFTDPLDIINDSI